MLTFRLKNSPVSHLAHITPHMHACGTSLLGTLSPGTSSRGKGVSLQYTERDASTLFTLSCIESGPYTLLWYSNEYQKILRLKIHKTSLMGRGSFLYARVSSSRILRYPFPLARHQWNVTPYIKRLKYINHTLLA